MVVDDDKAMRTLIRHILAPLSATFVEAADGNECLAILGVDNQIDLILLDWHMPKLDGFETLKALKRDVHLKDIPVIMATTESNRVSIVGAIRAGADQYLVKPFTADHLLEKVRCTLGASVGTLTP